jgi:hypothetical protein
VRKLEQIQIKSTPLFAGIYEKDAEDLEVIIQQLHKLTPAQKTELRYVLEHCKFLCGHDLVTFLTPGILSLFETKETYGLQLLTRRLAKKLPAHAKIGLCKHENVKLGSCQECHSYVGTKT